MSEDLRMVVQQLELARVRARFLADWVDKMLLSKVAATCARSYLSANSSVDVEDAWSQNSRVNV